MNRSLRSRANTRRAVTASICVGLMVALSACGGGGGEDPGSKQLDLVVGNELPLSGASGELGESGQKASDLAIKQINGAIGELDSDHTVRSVPQDQGPDPDSARQAAKTLVGDGGASCLTGPWSADAVEQVARDVAVPSKVLEIAPIPSSEDIAELSDHDLVNSTALPGSVEGSALSELIERELGGVQGRTVNVAASNDSYGDTVSQDFTEDWQGKDGTVGEHVVLAPPSLSAPQASQITSGGPAAVLIIDGLTGFSQLAPALSSSEGWDPATAWTSDQLVSPGLPKLVGAGTVAGMRALAPGTPKDEAPSTAFVQSFKAAQPRDVEPALFAAQEFDATILCYLAAVAAGSTDGQKIADELIDITAPGGGEFSWQQLPDAIEALEDGEDIDYAGASGPIDMDVHGNATSGVFDVFQYTAGGLEVVDEVSVEKPNPAVP